MDDPISALQAVRDRMHAACRRAGRPDDAASLIAVSKTFPADRVAPLIAAGQALFGENRVQEALKKIPQLPPVRWHLIGHLQRNKARHAVGAFELIHGVDNVELSVELDRRARASGVVQAVLVQVRLGGEATKSGVDPAGLTPLIEKMLPLDGLCVSGLMTIPPPVERPGQARRWFAELRELRDSQAESSGLELAQLSMGMTADFESAIEEGATLVRVGRAIFGERH